MREIFACHSFLVRHSLNTFKNSPNIRSEAGNGGTLCFFALKEQFNLFHVPLNNYR